MALQQAQTLLSMNSLEAVNVGVQQNNTEAFAVVLCHLAELHAEQVSFMARCTKSHLGERMCGQYRQSVRLESFFVLPLMSALEAKQIQGLCLASSCCKGCVKIKGRGACPPLFLSVLFLCCRATLQLLLKY